MSSQSFNLRHFKSEVNAADLGLFDDGDPNVTCDGLLYGNVVGPIVAQLNIGIIVCSVARRAIQTAESVQEYLPGVPIVQDVRAVEQQWGPLAGQSKAGFFTPEMHERAQAEGLAFKPYDDTESTLEVADRMLSLLADYEDYDEGNVLIVTHGQTAKALPAAAQGVDRSTYLSCKVPNGSLALLDLDDPNIRTPLDYRNF